MTAGAEEDKKALTEGGFSYYNDNCVKSYDKDSRIFLNGSASQGWCEPDASSKYLNITFELQSLNI